MEGKRRQGFRELRVGIFVVVTVGVLALAIFTIGNQVGLLEETFTAKTYLNNVSGLKPGDIVLLGGVEVGNVTEVRMSSALQPNPGTQDNQRTLLELDRFIQELSDAQILVPAVRTEVDQQQADYDRIVSVDGIGSLRARGARNRLNEGKRRLERTRSLVEARQRNIQRARANLQNIAVYMEIASSYRDWIKNDSYISLGSVGLLGDKYIEISLGRTDREAPVIEEDFAKLFGSDTREVVFITGQRQTGFQELITGANDILANFELLSDKLQDLLVKFDEGEGSVGKFFSDPSFYNNLNATVESAKTAADEAARALLQITEGEGTIPSLIRNPEVHDRILSVSAKLDDTMARIDQGVGTIGKLINDPAIYEKSDRMVANVERITKRMADGEGTLGKLSVDDQLYGDIRDSIEQLSAFLQDVEAGKGTLGRLAKDEQLYQNLNEVSSEVIKLLYDFRQNPKRFLTIKFELF